MGFSMVGVHCGNSLWITGVSLAGRAGLKCIDEDVLGLDQIIKSTAGGRTKTIVCHSRGIPSKPSAKIPDAQEDAFRNLM